MHDGDPLPPVRLRVVEGVAADPRAAVPRHHRHRLRHRLGVVPHLERVVEPDVQPLGVLPDDDEVDLLVAAARDDRLHGPHVGVEVELLPQRDGDRAVAAAHGRRERAFEREPGAPDRVERRVGQRGARLFHRAHAAELLVPIERRAHRAEHLQRRLRDLGADPVARDQRRLSRHGNPGVRLFTARTNAVQGSSPSPRATVRQPTWPVRTSTSTIESSALPTAPGVA